MKRIPLTQGMEALISDCDYKYLMRWKWHYAKQSDGKGGYARRNKPRPEHGMIFLHNVVAARKGIIGEPDHIDQDKLNCQRFNLRPATRAKNNSNRGIQSNNTSEYTGVSKRKDIRKWESYIGRGGKVIRLGYYADTEAGKIEAAYAYTVAAVKVFKEHACFIPVDHLLDSETKKGIKQFVLLRLGDK